jgi:4-diphosphocytidyl-2-C-methyl-D-erythritol kinase
LISFPNSKINIGLYVTSKRADGYHNIESVFYPVPCVDALEFVPSSKTSFATTGIPVPGNEEHNLCLKAYQLLRTDFSEIGDIQIHLHKMIPMGAGLGGGSADGAFMLNMLSEFYHLNLSVIELKNYSAQLGSDCPFFIENKPAFVSGRGEVIENISLNLSGWWVVLVFPGIHVSTQLAFSKIRPAAAGIDLSQIELLPVEEWKGRIENQFERSVFQEFPIIDEIKTSLYQFGATYASMSGSGSSVFGLFKAKPLVENFGFDAETRLYQL